ncbi:molecular chaperone TorD family protein [Ruegeria sp. 2205SS24-7]|uniref:molecular chaperone TorD family protein n=1 Tax=Ruegeria discodermiae TaxID=3064389 RepID=UPI0027404096|nr:molecular chaperone TorD family protein [Ruegeria sp. 2205SS24-7]MDP5218903.1 molecular chaperone TorD family protein [Ruegeria sp. 2205SS24-7]
MDDCVTIHDAELCRWFATVFAGELTEGAVNAYMAGAAVPYLNSVAEQCDISAERETLEAAIRDWSRHTNATRQLATDFAAHFLIPGQTAAMPYASYFEEQTLFGHAHDRMRARLNNAGLGLTASENGPADHLAVMLEYLAYLLDTNRLDAHSSGYVESEVLPLATSVSRRLEEQKPSTGFYPTVASILTLYLQALADRKLTARV